MAAAFDRGLVLDVAQALLNERGVTESAVTSLGWWCWSSEIEGQKNGPKCSRTRDQCDEDRAPVLGHGRLTGLPP